MNEIIELSPDEVSCHKGELQEDDFDENIGYCDNLDCGMLWTEKGMLRESVIKRKGEKDGN